MEAPEVGSSRYYNARWIWTSAPDPAVDPAAHQNTLYHSNGVCGNRSVSIPLSGAEAHKTLADTIFFILVGLVIVSWIVTLVRAIKRRLDN